ncbi:MAG: SPOR domain-containing protein [Alphaproteobacteria bacterium]|nr:SPOR domain-containing protein [Alphaproteobacteria bacterium]
MHPDFDPRDLEPSLPREEPKKRSRLVPMVLAGVGAIGVVGAGGYFALDRLAGASDGAGPAAHVRADPSPVRVRPDQPGGLQVPHQDKQVLETPTARAQSAGVERLLPGPEQPMARPVFGGPVPAAPGGPAPATGPVAGAAVNPGAVPPAIAPPPPRSTAQAIFPAAPPAAQPPQAAQPPVAARAQPQAAPVVAAPQPPSAPVPPGQPVARAGTPDVPPQPAPTGRGPVALAPAQPAQPLAAPPSAPPQVAQAAPAAAPRPQAPTPPAQPAAAGTRRIQLAAVGSREGAQSEWAKLQRAHPELATLQLQVQQIEANGRPVFRVQAGPLDDAGARRVCQALSGRGQACILVR